jgi:hypothetical protein
MMRQIGWSPSTEHFIPQAVLRRSPAFFEKELKLSFTDTYDGLDYFKGALLLKDGMTPVVLKQYRAADPGTITIYLSPDCQDLDYITRTVAEIVSDLGLQGGDVIWERKHNPEA